MQEVRVWHNVDRRMFAEEILPLRQPAVLKGLVARWPLVLKGLESAQSAANFLQICNPNTEVEYLLGDPAIRGRFFYDESLSGANFNRGRGSFRSVMAQLVTQLNDLEPASLAVQSLSVNMHLPLLAGSHVLAVLPPEVPAMIWIGNALTVAAHFDLSENIACVACGRRRFTLFPPDQLSNLYVGPLEATPQGVPISLVDMNHPDFERFPRFRAALEVAQQVELGPGDALHIPYMWWHTVQSLSAFNVLLNFWWNEAPRTQNAPFQSLTHAIVALRGLPRPQRDVWRAFFEHYVFGPNGDSADHIPPEMRGILGELTPDQRRLKLLEVAQFLGAIGPKTRPP